MKKFQGSHRFIPGKRVQVDLVPVDKAHVFKHAEDALQTQITKLVTSFIFLNFVYFSLVLSSPVLYQRCAVIWQGAWHVCELCKTRVDLCHGFDPRDQQLRHLFLWNLQRTHTESYWVDNIESVSKHNMSVCKSVCDEQIWFYLHMVHHHFVC